MKLICRVFYNLPLLTVLIFGLLPNIVFSKVDPPNYDFSVDKFIPFLPGKKISDILKKETYKVVNNEDDFITYQFFIEHIRYKFSLLVQTKAGVITDFHARLPQYFLHDVFHQSLINRYGKQDKYKKTEESALYFWNNKNNVGHIYSGTCTITCFPIFYSAYLVNHQYGKKYKRLLEKQVEKEY